MTSGSPPLTDSETDLRAARDGCDCDVPIARCAHFGDDSVYMDDWSYEEREVGRMLASRYDVWATLQATFYYHGNDYDAALKAFYAAEQALLRGDE